MGRGGTKPTEQSAYRVPRRGWGGVGPNPLSRVQSAKEGMGRGTKPTEQSAYRVSRRGWGGVGPNPLSRVPIECQGGDGEGWDQTH